MSTDNKPAVAPAAPPPPAPPAKAPPKNPGMVTFSVDGKEVIAKPGTNMIEAAKQVGVEIPYYCYHPRLSIAANCRMCLVQQGTGGKLIPACQTSIGEGMVINTQSPTVKEQQRAVMEFLLLNHPVDCSICDQAGECKLQDYYMRYDHKPSRLLGSKVLRNKRHILGPTVVLDQERCILCTRCVRFMAEVPKEPQLGVFGRGSHERIDVFPEQGGLTSNYAGNTVDICPVGALLNRDFRFRARAWFLSAAPSVCTGCSRGCSINADFMGQDVYRFRPRENEAINQSWLCDQGRNTYSRVNQNRIEHASIGRGTDAHEATAEEAVQHVATKLKSATGVYVMVSPTSSNEDLMASLSFAQSVLKAKDVYVTGRAQGEADHFLMMADKNPNRKGLEFVAKGLGLNLKPFSELKSALDKGEVKMLYGIGGEVPENDETFSKRLAKVEFFALQAMHTSLISAQAHVVLPACSHLEDEGSFTQEKGITQRFRRAFPPKFASVPHWKWAGALSTALGTATTYQSSRDVFKLCSPKIAELATFGWDKEAPLNQRKKGITPLAAAADGRPPGYRETGAPRVRGI